MGSRRESAQNLNHNSSSNQLRNSSKSINYKNVPSRIDTNLNHKSFNKERKSLNTQTNFVDIISKEFVNQNQQNQSKSLFKKSGSQQ